MGSWLMAAAMAMSGVPDAPFSIANADASRWLEILGVPKGAGRSHTRERLIVVDKDGRTVQSVDGAESHVVLSVDLDRLLTTPGASLTLVHNHPAGNGLSSDDLSQLEKAGVAMVVAIGHDGSMYSAARGNRFPATDFSGFDDSVYGVARRNAEQVLKTEREASARAAYDSHVQHVLATALDAAGVLDYAAALGPERRVSFSNARVFLARVRDAAAKAARR